MRRRQRSDFFHGSRDAASFGIFAEGEPLPSVRVAGITSVAAYANVAQAHHLRQEGQGSCQSEWDRPLCILRHPRGERAYLQKA